jgi:hypothetical protein
MALTGPRWRGESKAAELARPLWFAVTCQSASCHDIGCVALPAATSPRPACIRPEFSHR